MQIFDEEDETEIVIFAPLVTGILRYRATDFAEVDLPIVINAGTTTLMTDPPFPLGATVVAGVGPIVEVVDETTAVDVVDGIVVVVDAAVVVVVPA